MNEPELRDLFAAFAMLKRDWYCEDKDLDNARECFAIADAMIKARNLSSLEDVGIVAIKSRKRTTK